MIGKRSATVVFDRTEAAELVGLLAALSRAGLPPARIWQHLAEQPGPAGEVAAPVAAMLAHGGTASEGLLAVAAARDRTSDGRRRWLRWLRWRRPDGADGGTEALRWLAVTSRVAERTGAPVAATYRGLVEGVHEELAQAGEREIALAGPRTTARVLALLPVAGAGLALLIGVNPVAVLVGSAPGRICLLAGAAFWFAGRRWMARLLRSVAGP